MNTTIRRTRILVVKKWAWYALVVFSLLTAALVICGCASQARKTPKMDSTHYVAVAGTQPQPQQAQAQRPYQGPVLFKEGYWSDITYESVSIYSGTSTYKISSDGNSGSLSYTTIRTYWNTTKGARGSIVGPAGFGYGH